MLDICVFCQTRGTKIGKSIRNISLEGKAKMEKLRCRYAIKDKSELGTTVTIGRIVACYPLMMATVFATGLVPIAGEVPDGFPRFLCFPASPSLFPASRKDDLMAKWLQWQVSFSTLPELWAIRDDRLELAYGEFAYNNLAVPFNEREELYTSLLSKSPRVGGSGEPSPLEAIDCEYIVKLATMYECDKENPMIPKNRCFAYICHTLPLQERERVCNSLIGKSPRMSGGGEPYPLEAIECEGMDRLATYPRRSARPKTETSRKDDLATGLARRPARPKTEAIASGFVPTRRSVCSAQRGEPSPCSRVEYKNPRQPARAKRIDTCYMKTLLMGVERQPESDPVL
eukprot:GHVS01066892.1.p1 GENE.GHVS01066892.1~~GHVS01066892.1.p1  ORF type:complete len:343 (+),score=10.47 GHVS01066892.1:3-1031(+)